MDLGCGALGQGEGFGCKGPGKALRRGLGSLHQGTGVSAVPAGASAVVEHEGPVGVARAARSPPRPAGRAPQDARPVGERHARRQRLGSGAEGKAASPWPEHRTFLPPSRRKPVPGWRSGARRGVSPACGATTGRVGASTPGDPPPPPMGSEPSQRFNAVNPQGRMGLLAPGGRGLCPPSDARPRPWRRSKRSGQSLALGHRTPQGPAGPGL